MATTRKAEILTVAGHEVRISNPDKLLFPEPKHTKLDLVRYYMTVADGALRGAGGRPNMLVRYPDGIDGRSLLPETRSQNGRPGSRWRSCTFPPAVVAEEVVPRDAGGAPVARESRLPRAAPTPGTR